MIGTPLLQRIMIWLVPYRAMLTFAIISLLTIALTTSLLTVIIKQLIDNMNAGQTLNELQFLLLTIASLITLRGIATLASHYAVNWIGGKIGMDLRMRLFEKYLVLPLDHTIKSNPDHHPAHFTSKIDRIIDGIAELLTLLWKELPTATSLLIVMFLLNWEFLLMAFSSALVIGAITQLTTQAREPSSQSPRDLMDDLLLPRTSVTHIRSVKLDDGQLQESQYFCDAIERERTLALKRALLKTLGNIVVSLIIIAILAAFSLLFIQQLTLGRITIGDASALIAAILLLIYPLKRLLLAKISLQYKFQAIDEIESFLAQRNEIDLGNIEIARARGLLQLIAVSTHASSQSNPSLDKFTLILQPGEIVALSTTHHNQVNLLIDLIARFVYPTNGKILLDGIDISTLKLAELRANIAWITPHTLLMNDTIAANIAYGSTRCETEARIMKVARACHVTQFTRQMPHGLQTRIDNKSVTLTESQRQRILIARALLKNPAIVIVDDTSASFDTECAHVEAALNTLIHHRTTLIFSPQHALLKKANRIVTLT